MHICTISLPLGGCRRGAASLPLVARSIYVPLLPEEVDLLAAMAKQDKRTPHAQAAYLLALALRAWAAERAFEASLGCESNDLEDVA